MIEPREDGDQEQADLGLQEEFEDEYADWLDELEEVDPRWDEDQWLDDPRRGQAAGINRDNRGRG